MYFILGDALQDCTDTLLDQLDQQLKITEEEGKDYKLEIPLWLLYS